VSARLAIEVSTDRLDQARADVVVVAFFDSDRPLRGAAGFADWRLCGQLSRLLIAEKLHGASGEAVLLATGPGWVAPRILGLGLGRQREFDVGEWESHGRNALERVLSLRAENAAFPLSGSHLGRLGMGERVGAFLRGAVAAFAENSIPLRLQLIVSEVDAAKAGEAVQEFAKDRSAAPVVLQRDTGLGLENPRRAPRGGDAGEPTGTQIFK